MKVICSVLETGKCLWLAMASLSFLVALFLLEIDSKLKVSVKAWQDGNNVVEAVEEFTG
jgi:hypothetical protein